eukprot:1129606-Rhodomonas_salina.2
MVPSSPVPIVPPAARGEDQLAWMKRITGEHGPVCRVAGSLPLFVLGDEDVARALFSDPTAVIRRMPAVQNIADGPGTTKVLPATTGNDHARRRRKVRSAMQPQTLSLWLSEGMKTISEELKRWASLQLVAIDVECNHLSHRLLCQFLLGKTGEEAFAWVETLAKSPLGEALP